MRFQSISMKTSLSWLLTMALLWPSLGLKAQDSIYQMATWRTYQRGAHAFVDYWSEIQYERDTVLSGETYWVFNELTKEVLFGTWSQYNHPTILQIDSGVIRYWDHLQQRAFTYMNFNALPGDEWVIAAADPQDSTHPAGVHFKVDNVGIDTLQGVPTQWVQGHIADSNYFLTTEGKYYEFIGGPHGFLFDYIYYSPPGWSICLFPRQRLCHENPLHGLVLGPDHINSNCQVFDQLSSETEYLETLSIFPNPSSEVLYLEGPLDQFTSLRLIDLSGRSVVERSINQQENGKLALDIAGIPAGLYTLQLQSSSGSMVYQKIVKY